MLLSVFSILHPQLTRAQPDALLKGCASPDAAEMVTEHKESVFFFAEPVGAPSVNAKLSVGPKFGNSGLDPKETCLVVAFIGNTGVGKSRMIRHLQIIGTPPLAGSDPHRSSSSDVHAYTGLLPRLNKDDPRHYLILDTEGYGGTTLSNPAWKAVLKIKLTAESPSHVSSPRYPSSPYLALLQMRPSSRKCVVV